MHREVVTVISSFHCINCCVDLLVEFMNLIVAEKAINQKETQNGFGRHG